MEVVLAKGKSLDSIAEKVGLVRQRKWWFIKESDDSLRRRVEERINQVLHSNLSIIGVKVA